MPPHHDRQAIDDYPDQRCFECGQTTLAKAFQARVDEPFLRFSLDLLMFGGEVLPARRDEAGPFSWAAMRPMLFDGYYGCLAALGAAGNNIVVDHIVETQDQLIRLIYFAGTPVGTPHRGTFVACTTGSNTVTFGTDITTTNG
jgi:chloramphenicol 3-O-phosphotransferase